jgi:trimeric autotransporter adhesin
LSNTTGSGNTANGAAALNLNVNGDDNTADGNGALAANKSGNANTATGWGALLNNTTASSNSAFGYQALNTNTTGGFNTACGTSALFNNTTSFYNTATGASALFHNTTGSANTAVGLNALNSNTTASNGTASGSQALFNNTIGAGNTAMGQNALFNNTTGSNNVAIGATAGSNLTTGNNNIDIGANVVGNSADANTIRVGKQGTQKATFIAGIFGTAVSGSQVVVGSNGKLGVATSSARFKEAIKPMDKASEIILALKPVTFRYKEELDPDKIPQFGLVAEEVGKVNPDLVTRDEEGRIMSVRYEAVNAMLVNEFLKEHGRVQELKATVAQQQRQIDALIAAMQKVRGQLPLNKPAPQVVANDR